MNKHARNFGKWGASLSRTQRNLWGAAVTGLTFYSGQFVAESISELLKVESKWILLVHAAAFLLILVPVIYVYKWLGDILTAIEREQEAERATISHAYKLCDRNIVDAVKRHEDAAIGAGKAGSLISSSVEDIERIVQAAYQTFEAAYGKASLTEDRVDFEVTFMTESMRDGKITIPAAANKDGRLPRSMELRQNNPSIYDNSVTATLYRDQSPRMSIIPDTSEGAYKELYPGQKTRIQSSIVFPVLSSRNRLLGALVVHCDKRGFFSKDKEKFWSDLLEVFAKRIALVAIEVRSQAGREQAQPY